MKVEICCYLKEVNNIVPRLIKEDINVVDFTLKTTRLNSDGITFLSFNVLDTPSRISAAKILLEDITRNTCQISTKQFKILEKNSKRFSPNEKEASLENVFLIDNVDYY
ncbi:MAG: hypothetical protein ACE5K4_07400 [Candidatus Hydrothermarchaeota archaeon]